MTVYLVDMENIPHAWAKLLDACGAGDRFVLFYTEQVSQVPITLMEKVTQSQAAMDYVKCHSGPNGLDFQLVTEMGFRIARDPESEYVIVSQDHGFDVVVDYWADRNIQTKRVVPATGERGGAFPQHGAGEFEGIDCSNPQCVKDYLCWKLSNKVPKREIPFVAAILMDAMGQGNDYSANRRLSCRFTYLDRALRKLYGDSKGAKIRDQIKAVSREALILGLPSDVATFLSEEAGTEAPEEPAPMEAEGSETPHAAEPEALSGAEPASMKPSLQEPEPIPDPAEALHPRLFALGLPEERAREIAGILTEVLQSGQEHPRAKVYRKLLSAFGRKEGTALYQTVKDATAQILLERGGPLS